MPGRRVTLDPTRRAQVCSGNGAGSEQLKCFREPARTEGSGLSPLRTGPSGTKCKHAQDTPWQARHVRCMCD